MVPPKKYSAPATMSNGSTKLQKFSGGGGDMSYQKKDSGDVRKENKSANASGAFRTDTAISGNRTAGERPLQRWVPDGPPPQDLSLENSGLSSVNGKPWDQFAVNEQKFGVTTNYDPDIYTTSIDKKAPDYQRKLENADRIAREIEASTTNNSHIAEERVTDNFTGESGVDEEDKYSGVRRQQDFPPLASANRSNKYTTPARRAPTAQSTVSGAPVDPAIISSQLARPDKLPVDKNRPAPAPAQAQTAAKVDAPSLRPESPAVKSPATNPAPKAEVKSTVTAPAVKATPQPAKKIEVPASLTSSMTTVPAAGPNATATIERDLNASFKTFAIQQRTQLSQARTTKLKQDKEVKLNDLKKFSASFKLHSAVPADLIPIIAKDPAKQNEIRERSQREAEAKAKAEASAPAKTTVPVAPVAPSSDLKTSKPSAPHGATAPNATTNRQNPSVRAPITSQSSYASQNRNQQAPFMPNHGRPNNTGGSNVKMRSVDNNRFMPPAAPGPEGPRLSVGGQSRHPPTGPSMPNGDSRRSSGIGNQFIPKLNPNSSEFKPTFTSNLSTNANPSTASSPRSGGPVAQPPAVKSPFLRRKPLQASQRPSFIADANVLAQMKAAKPPPGKDYTANGGIAPPYEKPPLFKLDPNDVAPEKKMVEKFPMVFTALTAAVLPMSPAQPSHATPQVPHQHQLPFHLQQGAHAMPPRPSPRQHQMQMHHFPHGQPAHFNNHDDHRMMPSHSAQSFQSPRLNNVAMAYPSPMPQNAQLAYPQPATMQFPMGPTVPAPNLNRSYSGNGPPFYAQGAPVMGPPVMMPNPVNNGFMGPQGMVGPGQPMQMHGAGPAYYMPPSGGPPPMQGANGYPSPGRGGAPMMMNQGSQQGQPVYGMSPGMQFQQPVPGPYPQQQPGQIVNNNMRGGGFGPGQNYGTSPQQMYQFNQQNRGPGGNYNNNNGNKNYHPQQGPHTPAQQHQAPSGPQGRPVEAGDEAK